jgi:hypothetical protein
MQIAVNKMTYLEIYWKKFNLEFFILQSNSLKMRVKDKNKLRELLIGYLHYKKW